MSIVAWTALMVSLLALALFVTANYKRVITNVFQYLYSPKLSIYMEPGPVHSDSGSVSVGGELDDFEKELLDFQNNVNSEIIEIPIDKIRHPEDYAETDRFDISIMNNGKRPIHGQLKIDADMTITSDNPDLPDELNKISPQLYKTSQEPVSPGEIMNSETLIPQLRHIHENVTILPNGASSTAWYIIKDKQSDSGDGLSTFEIKVSFEPRVIVEDLPRWVPNHAGDVEFSPIRRTFVIQQK